MASSTPKLPASWAPELKHIAAWLQPFKTGIKFGHLQAPSHVTGSPVLRYAIIGLANQISPEITVHFIGSGIEMAELGKLNKRSSLPVPVSRSTYDEALGVFTSCWLLNKSVRQPPSEEDLSSSWKMTTILPPQRLIVLSVDTSMSAEFALALLAAMKWALEAAESEGGMVWFLTVSTEGKLNAAQVRLARLFTGLPYPERVEMTLFRISDYEISGNRQYKATDPDDLAEHISKRLKSHHKSKHALICYPDFRRVTGMAGEDWCVRHAETGQMDTDRLQRLFEPFSKHPGTIICLPHDSQCLIEIPVHYQEISIVVGETRRGLKVDCRTGQLTESPINLSRMERCLQLHLAQLTTVDSICYGPYEYDTMGEYIAAGPEEPCPIVSNAHMGGFIAATFALSTLGFDAQSVTECIVRSEWAAEDMLSRLWQQKVLRVNESAERLEMDLPPQVRVVFLRALPMVNWDYRLALLVASPSFDNSVRIVKAQLAALLASNAFNEMKLSGGTPLASECWGYTRPLSSTGTMWLYLGLFKRLVKEYKDLETANPAHLASCLDGMVTCRMGWLEETFYLMKNLMKLHRVDRANEAPLISDEVPSLDQAQTRALFVDLLEIFEYQLTWCICSSDAKELEYGSGSQLSG